MLGKDGAPIYGSPELVQNSQTTRALSYRCRDYLKNCRSNSVISRTNSQTTRALSHRRRYYSNKCRGNPVISRHYTASRTEHVITRTMSPWSIGGQEHARTYDKRRNVYDNLRVSYEISTRLCTRTVRQSTGDRQSTGELQDQYEKSSAHFEWRVVARFLNSLKFS